jgi:hypothetical protein
MDGAGLIASHTIAATPNTFRNFSKLVWCAGQLSVLHTVNGTTYPASLNAISISLAIWSMNQSTSTLVGIVSVLKFV